jgi:hypothetical protein
MKLMTVELPAGSESSESFFNRIRRALLEVPAVAVPWRRSDLHTALWLGEVNHAGFSIGIARHDGVAGSMVEVEGVAFAKQFRDAFGLFENGVLAREKTCFVVASLAFSGVESDSFILDAIAEWRRRRARSLRRMLKAWREQEAAQKAK